MIKSNDLREINNYLKDLNGKNLPNKVYVDNLHFPYLLLENNYILPPISNMDFTGEDIFSILEVFSKIIPEAISGCNVLPIQKPKREAGKISFVKEISFKGYKYLYIFKLEAAYLGGSTKEKIVIPASQKKHPAIETDRIYFSSRMIPIRNVIRDDQEIIDFEVQNFDKGLYFSEVENNSNNKPSNFSELFDEIDYSHILEPIKIGLKILHPNWILGKIYEPVNIEYLTLAVRFLSASYKDIYENFSHFYEILEIIHKNGSIPNTTFRNFIFWLKKHSFERDLSPSGNMRWRIDFS